MSDDNIISLAKVSNSSLTSQPKDALKDALDMIGNDGAFKNGRKMLILALDDTNKCYKISFVNAGMNSSECIALLETSKSIFLRQMGYAEFE